MNLVRLVQPSQYHQTYLNTSAGNRTHKKGKKKIKKIGRDKTHTIKENN